MDFVFISVPQDLNFLAFEAAFIAFLSPEAIFSAPTFFPLVGQPYFALNIEQLEKKTTIIKPLQNVLLIIVS